ncbi:uncharacterized protein LOC132755719 isoform X2 [Ruditapes philippinarum]|uniref:uncharacterized protein LOC132755719 isoform X2 n=1 Tax=Ruditapes philippinarum TaxID=129788 RepID=UPI00295B735C|nr:uncharacterized protein LOC132755719 isoform X2 [Ruditapes philippinarum]
MALLYEKVVSTVSKTPDERTDAAIEGILPWFRKKSELFKSQKAEIVKDILKNCQFMKCKKDFVIIKQGDKGDCFFIILNGSVAILIQTNLGEEGITYHPPSDDDEDEGDGLSDGNKQKKELDRSIFGHFVGKIPAGRSFGELALINADCVRNASIIADEATDLIIVNRELYNRSLKAFQEKEFNEKKTFVEEYFLFRGWHTRYKKQIAMSLRKEKICFDGIITKQGCPVDGICFLLSGQAKMLVDPVQQEIQYPDRFPLPDIAELEKVEARESIRREMNMAVPRTDEKKYIYGRPRSPGVSDRKRQHKSTEVCVIGAIEIIGDLEMAFGLPSYAETTQCTEAAEVFVLDQKNYERLIEKRNPQSLEIMRDTLHEKLKLRMSWAQEENLPLFRYFLYKLDERKRHELIKLKEHSRKRDLRESIDYWKSGKLFNGPLIDQFGPGSVFYTIRMRARSRRGPQRVKPSGMAFGITRSMHKNQSGAYLSRRGDLRSSNLSINAQTGTVKSVSESKSALTKHGSDGTEDELSDSDLDMDYTDSPSSRRSRVMCDGKKSRGLKSNKTRSSCSVDDFMNHELNELALTRLETKIEEWHRKVNKLEETRPSKADKKHLVKLHRYNAEESKAPLPGKKIILKPRLRPKPTALTLHLEAIDALNQSTSPPATATEPRHRLPKMYQKSTTVI